MAGAAVRTEPTFSMGPHTLSVPMALHELNRKRLCDRLKQRSQPIPAHSVVLLQGEAEIPRGSSDTSYQFRQESYFQWAFGVLEPDCFGAIDVATGRSIIFIPRLPETYSVWMGRLQTPDEYKLKYGVDEVRYADEMKTRLAELNSSSSTLLTLAGVNSDSDLKTLEAAFDGIGEFQVDNSVLFNEIQECRVIKTHFELEVMRFSNRVSSEGHKEIMRRVRPGWYEYQAEALFCQHVYHYGGMRNVAYTCIGASGCNCSVLHYGHAGAPNERLIRDGDLCLFDMGGEYYCYASDITCTFPANGKFTADQRAVYEGVLDANRQVLKACKPGVSWVDMHKLSHRVILQHLVKIGILKGDVDQMLEIGLGYIFMPHGLGHLLGLDVHDVGGYSPGHPSRPQEVHLSSLRTSRLLEENMVLTIEPGIYFQDALLDRALANSEQAVFIDNSVLQRFRGFGGVRIEDDVAITASGTELMTQVPRTVEEIEAFMAAGADAK